MLNALFPNQKDNSKLLFSLLHFDFIISLIGHISRIGKFINYPAYPAYPAYFPLFLSCNRACIIRSLMPPFWIKAASKLAI